MKNIFKIVFLGLFIFQLISCKNDDDGGTSVYIKPYAEQLPIDEAAIENYLLTHYLDADNEIKVIDASQTPLKNHPNLNLKEVYVDVLDLTYKLYYLKLDEGWSEGNNPSVLDSTFVTYKGTLLDGTLFDTAVDPVWFTLDNVVRGWSEIIPFFKSGKSELQQNGIVNYSDFGNGIMIIPSAFGYYSGSQGVIPPYSPLVFSFQLKKVRYRDHDRDKVLTKDELVYNPITGVTTFLDTDNDGILDYNDVDDDGDGILTKEEIRFTYVQDGLTKNGYYPFNGADVDDPLTPYDDTKGIPSCNGDFTDPNRIRRHLMKCN